MEERPVASEEKQASYIAATMEKNPKGNLSNNTHIEITFF